MRCPGLENPRRGPPSTVPAVVVAMMVVAMAVVIAGRRCVVHRCRRRVIHRPGWRGRVVHGGGRCIDWRRGHIHGIAAIGHAHRYTGRVHTHRPIHIACLGGTRTSQQRRSHASHGGRTLNPTGFRHGDLLVSCGPAPCADLACPYTTHEMTKRMARNPPYFVSGRTHASPPCPIVHEAPT